MKGSLKGSLGHKNEAVKVRKFRRKLKRNDAQKETPKAERQEGSSVG